MAVQLDTMAQTRLDELRAAEERQREIEENSTTRAVIPLDASKSQKKLIKDKHTRYWATIWTRHQMLTIIVVTLFSTASLFGILYMDTLSGFAPLQMLFDNSMDPGGIVLVGMSASFIHGSVGSSTLFSLLRGGIDVVCLFGPAARKTSGTTSQKVLQ
jgi:hypothetical protein